MLNCMLVLVINAIIMIFCGVTFLHINVALIWVYLFLLTILSIFDIILYRKKYIKSNKSIRRNYNFCFSGIYLLLKVFIINTFSDFASELPLLVGAEAVNCLFIKVILFALADYCMIRTLKEYSKRLIVGHMILQFVIMCVVRLIMVADGYAATGIIAENLLLSMMPMAMFGLLKR